MSNYSELTFHNNSDSIKSYQEQNKNQRIECLICNYRIQLDNKSAFSNFPCNVRAFQDESFKVWRCPNCQTIHCLDVVDLEKYYAQYPIAKAKLSWQHLLTYRNIYQRLTKHGLSKTHSILDYGCGVNGLFLQYIRQRGYVNSYGYDPYAPKDGFGNPEILEKGPFDYILLQDVLEHEEDPSELLHKLNSLLSPNGYILIGTPNASNIDLNQPELSDYYNEVHVPYHLHLYTRETLESLGNSQEWIPLEFFGRTYSDTLWFGFNSRAWNEYQRLCDRSIDVIYEDIKPWKILTSYKFFFYAIFGYWLNLPTGMAILFRKNT
ncbi:MAG: class I SAM-dependent methyltransferase [Desmonostoc geniculatum HA4340-LM1]|nr:class I SAM-dependent methyltransferase [Desmonostoc geniculatum HA4340-LM1]